MLRGDGMWVSRNISRTRALALRGNGISLGKHINHDIVYHAAGSSVLCFWWFRGGRIESFLHVQGEVGIKSFLHLI
jgi:hypothetical protein